MQFSAARVSIGSIAIFLFVISPATMALPGLVVEASPSTRAAVADDFYLEVTIVTGEHSRDSNSVTRKLTVSAGQLIYKEAYEGAGANRHTPVNKQFKLTKQDEAALIALLKTKKLLVTKTISLPPTQKGSTRYFELAIITAVEGQEHSAAIEASPSAAELKEDSLYQGSVSLIELLYRIINRSDPDITIPGLVDY